MQSKFWAAGAESSESEYTSESDDQEQVVCRLPHSCLSFSSPFILFFLNMYLLAMNANITVFPPSHRCVYVCSSAPGVCTPQRGVWCFCYAMISFQSFLLGFYSFYDVLLCWFSLCFAASFSHILCLYGLCRLCSFCTDAS